MERNAEGNVEVETERAEEGEAEGEAEGGGGGGKGSDGGKGVGGALLGVLEGGKGKGKGGKGRGEGDGEDEEEEEEGMGRQQLEELYRHLRQPRVVLRKEESIAQGIANGCFEAGQSREHHHHPATHNPSLCATATPSVCVAEVLLQRGKWWGSTGIVRRQRLFLHIEEAL
ncbi:unnamed protein product [Closterium sp. NIES-54]